MEPPELELLKKVLPDGYEVVNEGIADNGHDLVAVWDGDDWQHPIKDYTTAKQVIDKILAVERDWHAKRGYANGVSKVRGPILAALGIDAELVNLRSDLGDLRSEVRELNGRDDNRQRR